MNKQQGGFFVKVVAIAMLGVMQASYAWKTPEYKPVNPKDPYESFNRVMYNFNDFVDNCCLKPVANLYLKIVPKPVVKGISNVFANIDTIPTVANDVLQANFYQATSDFWRLAINSTFGIVGIFDIATDVGLEPNKEDFGLTLARWGYTNSNYLVLPFFGPSTVRDGLGIPVDYYSFSLYPYVNPVSQRYWIYGVGVVSRRADLLKFQDVMEQAAVDKYVFLRDAYMQRRNYLMQRNKELGDPYLEKNDKNSKNHESNLDDVNTEAAL
jgi:phospholipid-binding lipoprotein MlaA